MTKSELRAAPKGRKAYVSVQGIEFEVPVSVADVMGIYDFTSGDLAYVVSGREVNIYANAQALFGRVGELT